MYTDVAGAFLNKQSNTEHVVHDACSHHKLSKLAVSFSLSLPRCALY